MEADTKPPPKLLIYSGLQKPPYYSLQKHFFGNAISLMVLEFPELNGQLISSTCTIMYYLFSFVAKL